MDTIFYTLSRRISVAYSRRSSKDRDDKVVKLTGDEVSDNSEKSSCC